MAYDEKQTPSADKYTDDASLVKWIHARMKESKSETSQWRTNVVEDYSFYSGEQWSEEDAELLREQRRPAVVFNRCARTINAVSGLEVQNRQEVRYVARETSDNTLSDYYSAVVKWARDQCDAEDEDSDAFSDLLVCGMGWTQTKLEYDTDPDGMIEVSRFDPGEAFWDCSSRKRNLVDRKWCARVKRYYSADDVKQVFPNFTGNVSTNATQYVDTATRPVDGSPPFYTGKNDGAEQKKSIEVICFNWYDDVPVYRVAQSNGQIVELPEDKFTRIQPVIEGMGLQAVRQTRRKFRLAYVCGNELLSFEDSPVQTGFVYNCMTGLRDRNLNIWFGLIRLMVDPQRWANKFLSQTMHIMNSNSKGGVLAEKNAFMDQRKAETDWAKPEGIVWLKDGALTGGKIKERQMAQFPAGFAQLMTYSVEAINDTPGVNSELLGLADRNQPAILETTRKQAGIVMLGLFFDALRRYRKEQGRVLAEYVREYISDGRKIRIIGPQGKPEVISLMKDAFAFTYDIIVDDAPNSPSMKDKTFAALQALMPEMAKLGIKPPPEFLDYMPLPASLIEKWKKAMEPNPQQMAMQQQAMVLDLQEKAAGARKDDTQATLNLAKAGEAQSSQMKNTMEAATVLPMAKHNIMQDKINLLRGNNG